MCNILKILTGEKENVGLNILEDLTSHDVFKVCPNNFVRRRTLLFFI
jgi:hypothetical protein